MYNSGGGRILLTAGRFGVGKGGHSENNEQSIFFIKQLKYNYLLLVFLCLGCPEHERRARSRPGQFSFLYIYNEIRA